MLRTVGASMAVLAGVLITDGSTAQISRTPPVSLMRQYRVAAENTASVVRNRLRPLLGEEERDLFDRTTVVIERDSWDVEGIRAGLDDNPPTIRIPLGLIYLQDYIDSAVVATQLGQIPISQLTSYIHAVTDRVREASRHSAGDRTPVSDLPSFPAFAGLSPAEWHRIESSPQYSSMKSVIKLSTFAFILAHEFWHHLNPAAPLEERELKADAFAAEVGVKADFNPMLAFYTFMFYASIEGEQSLHETKPGYPAPLCRALYFFEKGRIQADADGDFMESMKSQGLLEAWRALPARLQKLLISENVTCLDFEVSDLAPAMPARDDRDPGSAARISVRVQSWRPTPGQCNGLQLELSIDGEHAATIKNMIDADPIDVGEFTQGEHEFSFGKIIGYCIEPSTPFRARAFVSGLSCNGRFKVRKAKDLRIYLRTTMSGEILTCALH